MLETSLRSIRTKAIIYLFYISNESHLDVEYKWLLQMLVSFVLISLNLDSWSKRTRWSVSCETRTRAARSSWTSWGKSWCRKRTRSRRCPSRWSAWRACCSRRRRSVSRSLSWARRWRPRSAKLSVSWRAWRGASTRRGRGWKRRCASRPVSSTRLRTWPCSSLIM